MKCLLTAADRIDMIISALREKGFEDPFLFESTDNYKGEFSLISTMESDIDDYINECNC
ncbi:hypothetical protein [Tepidibacillus marianensis]|uniref:hypothetical protein n=1 Tax=Tepidibacillus marianensis TaxID=3131995 RepID=UPI0030D1B9C0